VTAATRAPSSRTYSPAQRMRMSGRESA
jgi:hypothetical protein